MNEAFRSKLDAVLADYRAWSSGRQFSGSRWVHYTGVEMSGASDVPLEEVEQRMQNALGEGFRLGWEEHNRSLYFRVWEGEDEPPWEKVYAEESLVDIAEILRQAGFTED